ncbi:MAG: radical SAM protein [Candidatus Cloacimonetes bacterium]|jgi:MoaA/NifB/PqqE/SkfB family radical SAM enzyme|nr:radical SAM protein [Candidatus Cloacimonadota bacterium]
MAEKQYGSNKFQDMSWIASHWAYYLRLNSHVLKRGVPARELIGLKYPFKLPDPVKPPLLSVDFTDACDLACVYCNNPLFPHPRTMMSDGIFNCLLQNLRAAKINRVRVGGGEPMLHPKCAEMLTKLKPLTKYLSIITNGQWKDPHDIDEVLLSGVDLIEVSVDAGGAKIYEASRQNASYTRLLKNIRHLRQLRDRLRNGTLIRVRLMLRPSTRHLERWETAFWKRYADAVLPQFLLKHPDSDYDDDVFHSKVYDENTAPVCTLPFKDLQIRPDGRIPLCPAKGCSLDPAKRSFLGHVCHDSLIDIWNGPDFKAMRLAQRSRQGKILEGCKGCNYS